MFVIRYKLYILDYMANNTILYVQKLDLINKLKLYLFVNIIFLNDFFPWKITMGFLNVLYILKWVILSEVII